MYEIITHRAFWLAVKKCDACQVCKGNKGCIVAGMEKGNSEKKVPRRDPYWYCSIVRASDKANNLINSPPSSLSGVKFFFNSFPFRVLSPEEDPLHVFHRCGVGAGSPS